MILQPSFKEDTLDESHQQGRAVSLLPNDDATHKQRCVVVRLRNALLNDDDADEDYGALHDLNDPESGRVSWQRAKKFS